ncbi:hypothetical protein [Streptomyces chiangmaiensis]|uniref:DUF2933 domain-containing protein n=1 Tax=Streptomyces chiangmaiensis TaxID=766497 RepID=A0ABU7FQH2_9ACTN|nr:hypothetical protein [Streptomyces chiangmaiensis]MED7826337.1 hypothetical protein [Streptomyces chiangmaiensis]
MSHFLYVLPALACPVGMGLMMWFMMRSGGKKTTAAEAADPRQQELDTLRQEIAGLRTKLDLPAPAERERTR